MHVDMDAFFASVEQLDHPEWRGKPVIVGSPVQRGVVSTASYEARAFGVHSAMPAFHARRLCPGAIWAPPRFGRYEELSEQVRSMFSDITPVLEVASIDEAYLDVTPGAHGEQPVEVARALQQRVGTLGLSCSIGLAAGKTVAKIASDVHKPHGLTIVSPGQEAAFLAAMSVRALGGIGPSTYKRLARAGIRTLGELACLDGSTALRLLGAQGDVLVARAAGIDTRPVRGDRERKSVSAERTFSHDLRARDEVECEVRVLVTRVARRLRAQGMAGRTVTLKLRYADFTTRTASHTLENASDLEAELAPAAIILLEKLWTHGVGLRLLGFGVSGFSSRSEQLDLFSAVAEDETRVSRDLAYGIDRVRDRFGEDALDFGIRGIRTSPQDRRSPEPPSRDK